MRFAKMQGVGNDFVVIAAQDVAEADVHETALALCARHTSIGADGLLVIGGPIDGCSFTFRMFNPDGSEDMCGNGLRCASLWAYQNGLVQLGAFAVHTKDGRRECELLSSTSTKAIVKVNMGSPRLTQADIPMTSSGESFIRQPIKVLDRTFQATSVNTGSTHTVVFGELPADDVFFKYSPVFEHHPLYPERTSVIWTNQLSRGHFQIRIWERGAGETLGCGTGACAAALAAVLNDLAVTGEDIRISSKGGDLDISVSSEIWMTGPAQHVFEGSFD